MSNTQKVPFTDSAAFDACQPSMGPTFVTGWFLLIVNCLMVRVRVRISVNLESNSRLGNMMQHFNGVHYASTPDIIH